MSKRVSFDYDETLSSPEVQKLAVILLEHSVDVLVITARSADIEGEELDDWNNSDLFEVTDLLGIPRNNIIFCDHKRKYKFIEKDPTILWHLDDSYGDVREINMHTSTVGISVLESGWFSTCLKLLEIPYEPKLNCKYHV